MLLLGSILWNDNSDLIILQLNCEYHLTIKLLSTEVNIYLTSEQQVPPNFFSPYIDNITMIVGKNMTGKTRLLNTLFCNENKIEQDIFTNYINIYKDNRNFYFKTNFDSKFSLFLNNSLTKLIRTKYGSRLFYISNTFEPLLSYPEMLLSNHCLSTSAITYKESLKDSSNLFANIQKRDYISKVLSGSNINEDLSIRINFNNPFKELNVDSIILLGCLFFYKQVLNISEFDKVESELLPTIISIKEIISSEKENNKNKNFYEMLFKTLTDCFINVQEKNCSGNFKRKKNSSNSNRNIDIYCTYIKEWLAFCRLCSYLEKHFNYFNNTLYIKNRQQWSKAKSEFYTFYSVANCFADFFQLISSNILSTGEYYKNILFARINEIIFKMREFADIVILIDELESTFHPEWQRCLINDLIESIENYIISSHLKIKVQLICSTHSPLVLSDIPGDRIIYLENNQNHAHIKLSNVQIKTFGANTLDLYKRSFFMENSIGEFSKNIINKTFTEIEELNSSYLIYIDSILGDSIISHLYREKLNIPNLIELSKYSDEQLAILERKIEEIKIDRNKNTK